MNFSDFCETEPKVEEVKKQENLQNNEQNMQKNIKNEQKNAKTEPIFDENEIKDKIERYQNMSQNDLMAELIKESKIQKQKGNLDNKKLEDIKNSIGSLLDDEQKKRLDELIKMLR